MPTKTEETIAEFHPRASWWERKAAVLQMDIRDHEEKRLAQCDYSDEQIRQAIVHARQDIVLMFSYLASVNKQLNAIKLTLMISLGAAVATIAAFFGL